MNQQQEVELNDLPEEVLVTVFKQMDFKTLLQSSLVCKKWNEVIGQNSAIMMKIKLVVDFNREGFQLSPVDFERNYQIIKIIGLDKNWRNLPTLMNRYSSLRVLEIVDCKTDEMKKLNRLLARITKLEKLSIFMARNTMRSCFMTCLMPLHVDVSHHSCLKSLTVISGWTTLKFSEAAQLTSLKIRFCINENYSGLIDFLVGQKSLEVLTFCIFHFSEAEGARRDNILEKLLTAQFSLKKFVLNWDYNLFGSEKNFLLFMNKFANSLEDLQIQHQTYPESVYKMIFEKFRKLNTLQISHANVPQGINFYENLCENISIRELIVEGFGYDSSIQGFIGKLPNIQTLVLANIYLSKDIAFSISNNLKMLKDIQVEGISNEDFELIHIPSLTTITVTSGHYTTPNNCKQIVATAPNIETFNIQYAYVLDHKNIEILTEGWPHLKQVMIGKGFQSSEANFDLFLRNCKELKTLRIHEDVSKSYSEKDFTSDSENEKEAILRDFERAGVQLTFYVGEVREFTDFYDRSFKFE